MSDLSQFLYTTRETIGPYDAALLKALEDLKQLGIKLAEIRRQELELEQQQNRVKALARSLLKALPSEDQSEYLRAHGWLTDGPEPAPRGALIAGLMKLFSERPTMEWGAVDLRGALQKKAIHVDPKQVLNALHYLHAEGRITRTGRGQYVMAGSKNMSER